MTQLRAHLVHTTEQHRSSKRAPCGNRIAKQTCSMYTLSIHSMMTASSCGATYALIRMLPTTGMSLQTTSEQNWRLIHVLGSQYLKVEIGNRWPKVGSVACCAC